MSATQPETLLESLFFVTVRIEAILPGGAVSTGTGFLYSVPTNQGDAFFVVTNKHVIAGGTSVTIFFLKADLNGAPVLGEVQPLTFNGFGPENYYGHPDEKIDVAVIAVSGMLAAMQTTGNPAFVRTIGSNIVPTLDQLNELDAIEDIRFIGYPSGLYDTENYLPVVRRGTTASYLQHDYEGRPTFLIDASVFPGSSGSPVLIADVNGYADKRGNTFLGSSRVMLLGIIAEVKQAPRTGRLEVLTAATITPVMAENLDLGIVFKARTIDECVDALFQHHGITRTDISAASEPTAAEVADKPA